MTNQLPVIEISNWMFGLFYFGCLIVGATVGSFLVDLKWLHKLRRKKNEE